MVTRERHTPSARNRQGLAGSSAGSVHRPPQDWEGTAAAAVKRGTSLHQCHRALFVGELDRQRERRLAAHSVPLVDGCSQLEQQASDPHRASRSRFHEQRPPALLRTPFVKVFLARGPAVASKETAQRRLVVAPRCRVHDLILSRAVHTHPEELATG